MNSRPAVLIATALGVVSLAWALPARGVGIEFQVNSYTPDHQSYPAIAMDADRDFVVVWKDASRDGSGGGIFGARFAASGKKAPDFQVNAYTLDSQSGPAVPAGQPALSGPAVSAG